METVKATVPFLQENALPLTKHFYQRMFTENPEVKPYFNMAHQVSGSQQAALAGAVCAFAENIETPQNLAQAVELIGNKHASLGVKPEHYPIVGKHLLGAIDDLLAPAPPEILEAWSEAYGFLADVLIKREQQLYDNMPWTGFKDFRVIEIKQESDVIRSFHLKAADGSPAPDFKPGQYVTVRLPDGNGSTTMRNYSLSCHGCSEKLRISVKRESPHHADQPQGYASNYLHDTINVGDTIELASPCGEFFLEPSQNQGPILLLSGGIGVTPMLAMLHATAGKSYPVTFLQGAINAANHAFKEEIAAIAKQHDNITTHIRYSAPMAGDVADSTGLFDKEFLQNFLTPETEVFFCGPKPMMAHVLGALDTLGHPKRQIHYEFFGPAEELRQCPLH